MKYFIRFFVLALLVSVWFISACNEEEDLPLPIADFSFIIQGKTVLFTNLSQHGISYSWEFGDRNSSVKESPSHTYSEIGEYSVKLMVTNENGEGSLEKMIQIIILPKVDFSVVIEGKTVIFTNLSEYSDSYIWEFGDGNSSVEESPPNHMYSEIGEYNVRLTATNENGEESLEKMIQIIVLPEVEFYFSVEGKAVTFMNESKYAETYLWDFGNSNSSSEESPSITYERDGSYTVSLQATNDLGTAIKTKVIEIVHPVVIDGLFDDWEDIEDVYSGTGTISNLKIENSGNDVLYLYVEGSEELSDLTQIIINLDNDKTTGAFISWWYVDAGEDILIEGNLPSGANQNGSVRNCSPCDGSISGNWNWSNDIANDNIDSFMKASAIINIDQGKAYELAIYLKNLNSNVQVSEDGVGIAFLDLEMRIWAPVGAVPGLFDSNDNPNATPIDYIFK